MTTKEKLDALHGLDQQIKALQHKRDRLQAAIAADLAAQQRDLDTVTSGAVNHAGV